MICCRLSLLAAVSLLLTSTGLCHVQVAPRHSKVVVERSSHHTHALVRRAFNTTDPGVDVRGSDNRGWREMPDLTTVAGATLDTETLLVGDEGAILTHYITANYTASSIKRAVIAIHGDDRTSWDMQIYMTRALERATEGGTVRQDEVVIMSPQFFNSDDHGAFPANSKDDPTTNQMVWSAKSSAWGQGYQATNPANSNFGSFDALDSALAFFHNTTAFPALNTVVLAGFSMGGQLVQRYSVVRSNTSEDDRTHYFVSSPASFVYLNDSRPVAASVQSACSGYDRYKYGFSGSLPAYLLRGVGKLTTDSSLLQQRYVSRTLNFMTGLRDKLSSDLSCSALVQGDNHIDRIYNWVNFVLPYLAGGTGAIPAKTTVDYAVNVSHNAYLLFNSDPGIQRLFLDDYNGPGQNALAPPSNGYTAGQPSSSDLVGYTDSAPGSSPSILLVLVGLLSISVLLLVSSI